MREEQHQGLSAHADTRLPFQPVPGSKDPRNGIYLIFFMEVVLLIVFLGRPSPCRPYPPIHDHACEWQSHTYHESR